MSVRIPANSSKSISRARQIGSAGHRITGRQSPPGFGRGFVHVCIDDASRIAFSRVMKDERKTSAVAFLEAAMAITQASASRSSGS
jgi:hypothetical protein